MPRMIHPNFPNTKISLRSGGVVTTDAEGCVEVPDSDVPFMAGWKPAPVARTPRIDTKAEAAFANAPKDEKTPLWKDGPSIHQVKALVEFADDSHQVIDALRTENTALRTENTELLAANAKLLDMNERLIASAAASQEASQAEETPLPPPAPSETEESAEEAAEPAAAPVSKKQKTPRSR